MKLISVALIVRNEEKRIEKCLNSLLVQKGIDNVEILIIDGASTDKTIDIVSKFTKKYSFIKLIQCSSYGYSLQRNIAIKAASSEYILYISGDTKIAFNLIQRYLKVIENNVDVAQGTVINTAEESTFSNYMAKLYPIFYSPYLATNYEEFSTINVLIRKKLLIDRPFDEKIQSLEDKEWCFHLSNSIYFKRIRGAIVYHSVHETLQQYCKKIHMEAITLGEIVASLHKEEKQKMNIFNWITWTKFSFFSITFTFTLLMLLNLMNVSIVYSLLLMMFMICSPFVILFNKIRDISQHRFINILILYLFFLVVVFGVCKGSLKKYLR